MASRFWNCDKSSQNTNIILLLFFYTVLVFGYLNILKVNTIFKLYEV
jgi:hypothetical protein